MEWIIVWACVVALAIVVEVESLALVSSWFAGGGVVALLLAALDVDWMWQVIAFVVVSLGLLVAARPFLKKFLKTPTIPTNADVYIGKRFKLLADVSGGRSSVKINDVVWTVQVEGEGAAGDFVILKEISGNKYIAQSAAGAKDAAAEDRSNLSKK